MTAPVLNRRLSALDAAFLYFEKQSCPMHIGGISILDGPVAYEDLVDDIERRLHNIPRFLQRVVPAPLNVGHPTWEFDPDFDIHRHISMHQVRRPGSLAELDEVIRRIYSGPLDRNKPLWELHLILGLEEGRCAIASKIHHAMVDGVGGGELLAQLLDISPDRKLPEKQPYSPPPIPEARKRLVDALWDNTIMGIEAWSNYSKDLVEATRTFNSEQARLLVRALTELIPDLTVPPRRMPFNKTGSGELRVLWNELSFAEARAIRSALGVSVNDVVLSTLAGAIGRYARLHGLNTNGVKIRVMVPVNVRRDEEKAQLGNKVSMLPVRLPLDIEDPRERAYVIKKTMEALKEAKVSRLFSALTELWGGTVPPAALATAGSIAFTPTPIFSTICTNVPGPQIPLYQVRRRVLTYIPMVPVGYDLGVNCAIFTYNQKMVASFIVDIEACPDADELKCLFADEFAELRRLAGVPEIPMVDIAPRRREDRPRTRPADAPPLPESKPVGESTASSKTAPSARDSSATADSKTADSAGDSPAGSDGPGSPEQSVLKEKAKAEATQSESEPETSAAEPAESPRHDEPEHPPRANGVNGRRGSGRKASGAARTEAASARRSGSSGAN